MVKVPTSRLNASMQDVQEAISTKALASKTPNEVEQILKSCPDYQKVKALGTAFQVFDGHQSITIWYDEKAGTWVGQPEQSTGGVHCLQANGAYSPF